MICKTYDSLSLPEKIQLTGKAIHLLQSSDEICHSIMSIVRSAEQNGLLKNVTILPATETVEVSEGVSVSKTNQPTNITYE